MRKVIVLAGSLLSLFLIVPMVAHSAVFTDDFNDGAINSSFWTSLANGGPYVQEANGQLEVTLPSYSNDGSLGGFNAGYRMLDPISGDFFAQVDYSLLAWGNNNGVRVGINIGEYIGTVQRNSDNRTYDGQTPGTENYSSFFPALPAGSRIDMVPASSLTGGLAVERIGDVFNTYVKDGSSGAFELLHSFQTSGVGGVQLGITAWSHDYYFADQTVKIAFDNFRLEDPTPTSVPEPGTMMLLGSGLVGLIGFGRKKISK